MRRGIKLRIAVDKIKEKLLPSCPAPQTAQLKQSLEKKTVPIRTKTWLW